MKKVLVLALIISLAFFTITLLTFPHTILLQDIKILVHRLTPVSYDKPNLTAKEGARRLYEKCHSDSYSLTCYIKEMEDISYHYGRQYAYETLHVLKGLDEDAQACHFFAHGIGWGIAKKDPENWRGALKNVSSECDYGETHGILEYYVTAHGGKITTDVAKSFCGKTSNLGCSHPLGHIFLVETKGNVDQALNLCDSLGGNGPNCYHGAFMEHHVQGNLLRHGQGDPRRVKWMDFIDEDAKFCMKYKGDLYKEVACWGRLAHSAYWKFDKDPRQIFAFCNTGPSQEANSLCKLISLSELLPPTGMDFKKYRDSCTSERDIDPEFESRCYNEFIKIAFAQTTDDFEKTAPFCLTLQGTYRISCIQTIGSQIKYKKINADQAAKICESVKDARHKSICLG